MRNNHYIFALLFILIFDVVSSQITEATVHYDVNIDTLVKRITDGDANSITKNMYIDAGKAMDNISFTLNFKNNQAVFKKDINLAIDGAEKANKMAAVLASQGTFYTDLTEHKQLLVREFQGETFNVPSVIPERVWELTTETKTIGNFKCYKAIMTAETSAGSFPVTAWYTPEIPLALGPNNFVGNLPGLLLELHDTAISFTCTSLKINPKKEIVINWPQDIDLTSEEDYKKAGESIKEKLKRNN